MHWEELLRQRKALSPFILAQVLRELCDFLTHAPGSNLHRRSHLVPGWLQWWVVQLRNAKYSIPYFDEQKTLFSNPHMVEFEKVPQEINKIGRSAGVLFVAGAEGHWGHVEAFDYMEKYVLPIWIFEQDAYLKRKKRKAPFIPLEVRLSMWAWIRKGLFTVSPAHTGRNTDEGHYQYLFNQTRAQYSFSDEQDPNVKEKINRGRPASFTTIPHVDVASTSEMVLRLRDDDEADLPLTLYSSTDLDRPLIGLYETMNLTLVYGMDDALTLA